MISVNKYLFLLLLLFPWPGNAQNEAEQQFRYAMKLYDAEDYFHSVTELKRLLFFDTSGYYNYRANLYIGRSYKAGARLNDAILYFSDALHTAANPDEVYESKIEIVKSNILRRTFSQAHSVLNKMESEGNAEKQNEIIYWRGWIYLFSDEWDKAAEEFKKIDPDHELARLALQVDEDKYSVTLAKTMSYILPGSGQFYTGNYLSGVLSLGWNVLWGYLTINAFIEERVFDGFAIGTLLWLRFYNGSIQNAEKFAVERNLEISNKALNYLQYEYTGQKP